MSPWFALIPTTIFMCLGSWLSYHELYKRASWFPAVIVTLSALNGLVWAWASRVADLRTTYSLSIAVDGITILAYSLLPLVVFSVRLSALSALGVVLVIAGAVLVKMGEHL